MNLTQNLFGDELLSAVFANFSKAGQTFKATEGKLMLIFHHLFQRREFRPLALGYPFDTDGFEPRSKALSDAFESLQQSRMIGRMNPDLVEYRISDALHVRYQKFIEPKLKTKKTLVRKLAQEVEKELLG